MTNCAVRRFRVLQAKLGLKCEAQGYNVRSSMDFCTTMNDQVNKICAPSSRPEIVRGERCDAAPLCQLVSPSSSRWMTDTNSAKPFRRLVYIFRPCVVGEWAPEPLIQTGRANSLRRAKLKNERLCNTA